MMSQSAFVLFGIPGSGKTTLSGKIVKMFTSMNILTISRDEIRFSLLNSKTTKKDFDISIEDIVNNVSNMMIEMSTKKGRNIIIDETNVITAYRHELFNKLICMNYTVHVIYFVNYDEALRFNLERDRHVENSAMSRMYMNAIDSHIENECEQLSTLNMFKTYVIERISDMDLILKLIHRNVSQQCIVSKF